MDNDFASYFILSVTTLVSNWVITICKLLTNKWNITENEIILVITVCVWKKKLI